MGVLKWLQVGIALFLAFRTPVVAVRPDSVTVTLEMENLLTEEMRELLVHGVDFRFELYSSLAAVPRDPSGKESLSIVRIERKISYDYLRDEYVIADDGAPLWSGGNIGECIRRGRLFEAIRFPMKTDTYGRFSLFAQTRLLEDETLRTRLGFGMDELWLGYKPSVRLDFVNGGAP
jgi:hypothetical protein